MSWILAHFWIHSLQIFSQIPYAAFSFCSLLLFLYNYISLWLCWVSVPAGAFLSFGEWSLLSSCVQASYCSGLSFCRAWALGHVAFSSWQLPGSRAQIQQLWCIGLVASQHMGSSPNQGLNPCLLNWQVDFFTAQPLGKPCSLFLLLCRNVMLCSSPTCLFLLLLPVVLESNPKKNCQETISRSLSYIFF